MNEILSTAAKERTEGLSEGKPCKGNQETPLVAPGRSPLLLTLSSRSAAPTVQQRNQLEELRKFGKEFRVSRWGQRGQRSPV